MWCGRTEAFVQQLEQECSGHAEGESDLKRMCQPGESCRSCFQGIAFPAAILSRCPCPTVCAHAISAIFLFLVYMHSLTKTAMAKSKSFSSVASDTWNRLPCHLSSISAPPAFRKRLKHHLFLSVFLVFPLHPLTSRFVMSSNPWM